MNRYRERVPTHGPATEKACAPGTVLVLAENKGSAGIMISGD